MANLILTAKSNFKPFSFDEYMKPFLTYKNEYDKMEAFAGDLSALTESIRDRAEQEYDQDWAKQYFQYANSLQNAANDLYTNGLNVNLRRQLNQLKQMYTNKVQPAQNAIKRQAEITKALDTINPQLRMMYAEMPSIAALIKDPSLTRTGYSGAQVEQSAMDMAKVAASRNVLDRFTPYQTYWMKQLQQIGYSKEVMEGFRRDMKSIPELNQIFEDVEKQFNNFQGLSQTQKDKMTAEIMSGILKGAGFNQTVNYQQNAAALENLRYQNQLNLMKKQHELEHQDTPPVEPPEEDLPEGEIALELTDDRYTTMSNEIANNVVETLIEYARTHNDDSTRKINKLFDKYRNKNKVLDKKGLVNYLTRWGLTKDNLLTEDPPKNVLGLQPKYTPLYNILRTNIRNNVTRNEGVIDDWTLYRKPTAQFLSRIGNKGNPLTGIYSTAELNKTVKVKTTQINLTSSDKELMFERVLHLSDDKKNSGVHKITGVNSNNQISTSGRFENKDVPEAKDIIATDAVANGVIISWMEKDNDGENTGKVLKGFIPYRQFSTSLDNLTSNSFKNYKDFINSNASKTEKRLATKLYKNAIAGALADNQRPIDLSKKDPNK